MLTNISGPSVASTRELIEYGRRFPQSFRLAIAEMHDEDISLHCAWIAAQVRQAEAKP